MKRKVLSQEDAMCGTGWVFEHDEIFECPNCEQQLEITYKTRTIKCPECEKKLIVKRGVLNMLKVEEK